MNRKLLALSVCIVALCLAAFTAAGGEEGVPAGHEHHWTLSEARSTPASCTASGINVYTCDGCSETKMETVSPTGHSWVDGAVLREATCAGEGIQNRTCSVCGREESVVIPKTGEHTWGEWTITREPTCLASGIRTRTCTVCGKAENETITKREHAWSGWSVTQVPDCTKAGRQQRTCSLCGATEKRKIEKLGHDVQDWNIIKEPTCKKTGQREGNCDRCEKKITERMPVTGHIYDEWEVLEEATAFSKGKHRSACRFCGRKKTEEFYPDGTLGAKLDNDPDEVKALQSELKKLGLYRGEVTGKFDNATENAVKKAEKGLGVKSDGIAWPGVLRLLGAGDITGNEITRDSSKYLLRLEVKQSSEREDAYSTGDELVFDWKLTNSAKKSACSKTRIFEFDIVKAVRQKDALLEDIGTLKAGESVSGTYVYRVTEKDVLAGRFSLGFTAKGTISGNAASSNTVMFVNACAADGEPSGQEKTDD